MASLRKYQIVSLLAMLQFAQSSFVTLMRELGDMLAASREMSGQLDNDNKAVLQERLRLVERQAVELGLDAATAFARDFIARLNMTHLPPPDYSEVAGRLEGLRGRIEDQLQGKLFMFIPNDKAECYREKNPFGQAVTDKWPSLAHDIEEASKCFAAARYTATVFHLMRIMEVGVQGFADRQKVKLSDTKAWGQILGEIDASIAKKVPKSGKARVKHQESSELATYLRHVKNAWRDATMHPKATYTEEEAKDIFGGVRAFMIRLAKMI